MKSLPFYFLIVFLVVHVSYIHAAPLKVTGTVKNGSGYSVYLLSKDGSSKTVTLGDNGKFSFSGLSKNSLKKASLQLVNPDGQHFGPVVFASKGSKVSTTFSGRVATGEKQIALGKITLNSSYGTISAKKSKALLISIGKATVAAVSGKPIGVGEQGLVQTASSSVVSSRNISVREDESGGDLDLDGVPDSFDADDDGDLVLDASDTDSVGGDVPYSTLNLDFRRTINSNVRSGLTDSAIDEVIGGENVFNLITFLSLPTNIASSVTGGHVICDDSLVYCRPNTPTAYYGGVSESSSEFRNKSWSDLLTDDGFPRLEKISLSDNSPVMVAAIEPRVGRDQFRPGDVFRTVLTGDSGEISSRTFTLAPYFVSSPALKSYDAGSGTVTVDYSAVSPSSGSIPGTSSSDPIILSSQGILTVVFWRPQRAALRSDETGYYDWGHINYGVTIGDVQATCAGLYSSVSSDLAVDSTPFGTNDSIFFNAGANGSPYRDLQDDRAADASNTLTFSVDLKECLSRAGTTPSGTFLTTLVAAGESVTGGQSSASQLFYVQVQ